jgi:FdhD protein
VSGLPIRGPAGSGPPPRPVTEVRALAYRGDRVVELPEALATEEPLEIRVGGPGQRPEAAVVTMRTPGHDFELAAGFLTTEGLCAPGAIASVAYCADAEPDRRWNTVSVALRHPWDPATPSRDFMATSACGVCGKSSIDAVELACPTVPAVPPYPASLIPLLPDRLRGAQRTFERTGGLHAAALFDRQGAAAVVREDVGRHNAVDKVVGHLVLGRHGGARRGSGEPVVGDVLVVSGRVSFELVQKAAMAGIGVLAAVSAPSSLAVQAADRLGIAVVGFVRSGRCNVYTHAERLDLDA